MNSFRIYLIFFLVFFASCRKSPEKVKLNIPAEYSFKNQIGYVNDFDDILSISEENDLEKMLADYDNATTNEIGVVSIKSIQPFKDIIIFNDELLEEWRFGKDDQFNGLIILIDKKSRQLSIRFGTGLQQKLSDAETQLIIDNVILPEFKKGKYYLGIEKGIEAIKKELE